MILYKNSTVSGNTSQVGGGIYTQGSVTLQNTILAGNAYFRDWPRLLWLDHQRRLQPDRRIRAAAPFPARHRHRKHHRAVDPLLGTFARQMVVQRSPRRFCPAARPSTLATRLAVPISRVILLTPTNEVNPASVAVTLALMNCSRLGFSAKLADRQVSHHWGSHFIYHHTRQPWCG